MNSSLASSLTALAIVLGPALLKFAGVSPADVEAEVSPDEQALCVAADNAPVHKKFRGSGDVKARLARGDVVQVSKAKADWWEIAYVGEEEAARGWIQGDQLEACASEKKAPKPAPASNVRVCSFNIQFLGHFKDRDDEGVAAMLRPCDVAVVQELVAPPYPIAYPDGSTQKGDPEARRFFEQMERLGFRHVLSEEDTGTGDEIHDTGPATEWWVAFYRPAVVMPAPELPHGFLAEDRSNHRDYERVPYAFSFQTHDGHLDFALISVHLQPGDGNKDAARRKHELGAIAEWIGAHSSTEKDFIILGDMNLEDCDELADVLPEGFLSLNGDCRATNTNPNGPKPYDHVMYAPAFTKEMDASFGFKITNLVDRMAERWDSTEPYPGEPYEHDAFRVLYSDHDPVRFRLRVLGRDDD